MKLTRFSRLIFSISIIIVGVEAADACGPYNFVYPNPKYFTLDRKEKTMSDFEREENIRLWNSFFGDKMDDKDIEEVVYKDDFNMFAYMADISKYSYSTYTSFWKARLEGESVGKLEDEIQKSFFHQDEDIDVYPYTEPKETDNKFYLYLRNRGDYEIVQYLLACKSLEKVWELKRDPWYYPLKGNVDEVSNIVTPILEFVNYSQEQMDDRLQYRIALLEVKCNFASDNYAECIKLYEDNFADVEDTNLMKRMAKRYAAGSWKRLGNKERADSMFASIGDIRAVTDSNRVKLVAELNPNAPQLIEYLRARADDSEFLETVIPTARKLLKNKQLKNRGDWEFLLAHYELENDNKAKALNHINKALHAGLSTEELNDRAQAMKIKLNTLTGNLSNFKNELKWLDQRADYIYGDYDNWKIIVQDITFGGWIPTMKKRGDNLSAVTVAAWYDAKYEKASSIYSTQAFEIMDNMTSSQLISLVNKLKDGSSINPGLNEKLRVTPEFFDELIGTVALREENYDRAIYYLSRVSESFQRNMNIYDYLEREPLSFYPNYPDEKKGERDGAKLRYAKSMKELKEKMMKGATRDERGLARIKYAQARRNAQTISWAYLYYLQGTCIPHKIYISVYDSYESEEAKYAAIEKEYQQYIEKALSTIKSDKGKAEAEYLLGNLVTVVKQYGATPIAKMIRTSCDNWQDW